jgi:STELLO glycosyltransferases
VSVAVITTSINEKPEQLEVWAGQCDRLIVAGDNNTPPALQEYLRSFGNAKYLSPYHQHDAQIAMWTPWKSIQRRNFALLEAIREQHDYIVTVDDDNLPDDGWTADAVKRIETGVQHPIVPQYGNVFDPGSLLDIAGGGNTYARGLPLGTGTSRTRASIYGMTQPGGPELYEIGVFQGMSLGDPDIDAMERIVNSPMAIGMSHMNVAPVPSVFSPLNSQSTMYTLECALVAAVLPHVGRMDDIWGGYIMERIIHQRPLVVEYGRPLVYQDRNSHNLIKDLEQEMLGYKYTQVLLDLLDSIDLDTDSSLLDSYMYIADQLWQTDWFPKETVGFMRAWVADVEEVLPA